MLTLKSAYKWLIVLFVFAVIYGAMSYFANSSLKDSIAKVEKDRDEAMVIQKKFNDLDGQISVKAQKLITSTTSSYYESKVLYNDFLKLTKDGSKIDEDFITNAQKQVNDFKPKLTFALSKNKKTQAAEIKKSLETEYKNCILSKDSNNIFSNTTSAILGIVLDLVAADEAKAASSASDALAKALPLQKYTNQDFIFENEALIKKNSPRAYTALENSKDYFSYYYNYLSIENTGEKQEGIDAQNNLDGLLALTVRSIRSSMDDKSLSVRDYYLAEIAAIDQYLQALDSLKISYNKGRETGYYVMQSVGYYSYRTDDYPVASNFDALKKILNLKYGSSDLIKYSYTSGIGYNLEYYENGKWVKIQSMLPDSLVEIQSNSI